MDAVSRAPDRLAPGTLIDWSVASRSLDDQILSGDRALVKTTADGVLVAVVDALGHGGEASAVAELALATLDAHAAEGPLALMKRCDEALRKTRGAVMTLASLSAHDRVIAWLGVGNVEGVLVSAGGSSGAQSQSLMLRGGVVGYRLPRLFLSKLPIAAGDTLVLATDGLRVDFARAVIPAEPPQAAAERILAAFSRGTDDALVLVARYLGAPLS
jgi:serine phosphatase RsbU (regulator of sigma subunit)